MKKYFLISLLGAVISSAYADIPLPPPPGPGGYIVSSMQANQQLEQKMLENKIMQEKLEMMRERRAMIEMQENRYKYSTHKK